MHSQRGKAWRQTIAIAVASATVIAIAGCTAPEPEGPTADDPVSITVGGQPPSSEPELLAAFNARVDAFAELHPEIEIEAVPVNYDPQTFNAMLSGGTLPTTFNVPFPSVSPLMEQGALYDLTDIVEGDELLGSINSAVAAVAENGDGRNFGIPNSPYSFAVMYNRDYYEQVGLDPDQPPQTWDELRENAKLIADELGVTGLAIPTTETTGGWTLIAMTYAFGSLVQSTDADGTVTVDFTSDAAVDALQWLRDVRWTDDAFGDNILLPNRDVQSAFAAGQIGHYLGNAGGYRNLVGTYEMAPEDVGIAPLPQQDGGVGTLGGGQVSVVSPRATEFEAAAAVEWIKFYYLSKYGSEEAAVADAETLLEAGLPVGAPAVPLFSAETEAQYLEWIADQINVDRALYSAYLESEVPIVAEPPVAAGALYGLLSSVIQEVLSNPDVDPLIVLRGAEISGQALVDEAQ